MPDDRTAYCVEGCGRPAETSRPLAVTRDGDPITELVCWQCKVAGTEAAEQVIATYLANAPEQGDWLWEDHCDGLAGGIGAALNDAGWRIVRAETSEVADVTSYFQGWSDAKAGRQYGEGRRAASSRGFIPDNRAWFDGSVRCPDCRHYCADHAACSPEPGGAGPVVDCSCANGCHF